MEHTQAAARIMRRAVKVANRQMVEGTISEERYVRVIGKAAEFAYQNTYAAWVEGLNAELKNVTSTLAFKRQAEHLAASITKVAS